MWVRTMACAGAMLGLASIAQAEDSCTYETSTGYAHIVSVPALVIASINVKYQNAKFDPSEFPEEPEPGQVYQVEIQEIKSGKCKPALFKILKRVQ